MTPVSFLNPEIEREIYENEKTNAGSSYRNKKKFNNYDYLTNEENFFKKQISNHNKNKINIDIKKEELQVENFNLLDEKENLIYVLANNKKRELIQNKTLNLKKENIQEQVKKEITNKINEQKVESPTGYQSYQKAVNVFKKYIQINKHINEKLLEDQTLPLSYTFTKSHLIENKGEPKKFKYSDENDKEFDNKIKYIEDSEKIIPHQIKNFMKTKDYENYGNIISPIIFNDKVKFSENEINELISQYLDKNNEENINVEDNKSYLRYVILNELKTDKNLDIEIEKNYGDNDLDFSTNLKNQSYKLTIHDKRLDDQEDSYNQNKYTFSIPNKNFEKNYYRFNNIKIAKFDKIKEILNKIPNIISVFNNNNKCKRINKEENTKFIEDKIISKFFNVNNLSKLIDLSNINIKTDINKNTNELNLSKKEILDSADNMLNNHILKIKKINNCSTDRNFSSEKSGITSNTFKEKSINNTFNYINQPDNISSKDSRGNMNKKINYVYGLLQNYAKAKINDCLKNPEFKNKKENQNGILRPSFEKTDDKNIFTELNNNKRPNNKEEESDDDVQIIHEILKKEENIPNKIKIKQELFNIKNAKENKLLEETQIKSNKIHEKINHSNNEMININNHKIESQKPQKANKISEINEFGKEFQRDEIPFTINLKQNDFIKEEYIKINDDPRYLDFFINNIGTGDCNMKEQNHIHPTNLLKEGIKLKSNLKKDISNNEEIKNNINKPIIHFAKILHSNSEKIISSKNLNSEEGNNTKINFESQLEPIKNSNFSEEELDNENIDEVVESKNKTINCDIPYRTKENQTKVRFSNKIFYIQYHEESTAEEIKICNQNGKVEKHKKLNLIQYLIKIKNKKFKPKKILHHYYNGIRDDRLPKKIVGYLKKSNSFNELDKEIGLQKINKILDRSTLENEQSELQEKNRKRIVDRNLNTIHAIAEARKKGSKIKKARSPTPRKIVENVICKKFKGDPNKFYSKNPPNSLLKISDIPIVSSSLKMSNSVGRFSERISNKNYNFKKKLSSQTTNQSLSNNRTIKRDKNKKPNEFNLESCISKKNKNYENKDNNYISNINFKESLNDIEKEPTQFKETENFNEIRSHNSLIKSSKED